ncbi:unnamed protein product, partial [Rotaria magnacalcarata]
KGSNPFVRQDGINSNGKGTVINRDLSDDADLDRHGSTSQQITTNGVEEAPVTVAASSAF